MANEFYDLFNQLFYSTEVWGYLGVVGIIILCIIIVKRVSETFPFLVMLQVFMMITYFDKILASGYFIWHIIILLVGVISTGLIGAFGLKK